MSGHKNLQLLQAADDFDLVYTVISFDMAVDADGLAQATWVGTIDNNSPQILNLNSNQFTVQLPDGTVVAQTTSDHVSFNRVANQELTLTGHFAPEGDVSALITAFSQGESFSLVASGSTSDGPLLLDMNVAGAKEPLITSLLNDPIDIASVLGLVLTGVQSLDEPSRFIENNPFTAPLTITAVNFDISFQGTVVGSANVDPANISVDAGPGETLTDPITSSLDIGDSGALGALTTIDGDITDGAVILTVAGSFDIQIGDFSATVPYTQDVPTCECDTATLEADCGALAASAC